MQIYPFPPEESKKSKRKIGCEARRKRGKRIEATSDVARFFSFFAKKYVATTL